jgi:hypothetical protein
MSHFKEYKFFRSFSAKVENWPMRKAEALWRRMRERKIAGRRLRLIVRTRDISRYTRAILSLFAIVPIDLFLSSAARGIGRFAARI